MEYKLAFRPLATLEILEAYDWYELQKEGLGNEFLKALDQFVKQLLLNPHTCSFYEGTIRQGKVNRFPYVVVYEVFETDIIVYSVFMAKQNPAKKRLK
jgi:toxin ParE1/3/4